jgi:hypothetical protein
MWPKQFSIVVRCQLETSGRACQPNPVCVSPNNG